MSRINMYICDVCGKEVDQKKVLGFGFSPVVGTGTGSMRRKDACEDCAELSLREVWNKTMKTKKRATKRHGTTS